MKYAKWIFLIFTLFIQPSFVFANDTPEILKLVYGAKKILKDEKPKLIWQKKKVIGRSVPIAIYDAEKDKTLVIWANISLERDQKRNGKIEKVVDVFSVRPPEFKVVKRGGNGINTDFKVTMNGNEYPFLGWHYVKHNKPETLAYSPYTDYLSKPEVIRAGKEYHETQILEAHLELKKLRVHSRAIPGMLIADLISESILFNLALIEHMDHDEYKEKGALYMRNKVLTQFALNRENTFSYSNSHAGAMCLMQIMRSTYAGVRSRKGKFHKGILQLYPTAKLPSDSFLGSCGSHVSAIKAAYLVLDDKLANMPASFKAQFITDPARFGFILAAAYNGGHSRAINLYKRVSEPRLAEIIADYFGYLASSKKSFHEYRILRHETWIFVKKYIEVDAISNN